MAFATGVGGDVRGSLQSSRGSVQGVTRRGSSLEERSVQSNMSSLGTDDSTGLEEMDPALADGHRVVYDREVPFELRPHAGDAGPQDAGSLEAIRCKILVLGEEHNPHHCKVELTSESDVFFHYVHAVNEHDFRAMQEDQKLMVDFPDYTAIVIKMLNQCIKEPHSYLAVFVMQPDGSARLDFIHNMQYKFVELLSCCFAASPEDVVRQQVRFRFNSTKSKLAAMQSRLQAIHALVKVKSPSLLLQLQKMPNRVGLKH
mmetsp:Transcript_86418/g.244992  ORF Transcript_86418/g.244992 Transcript_86418/m.244992 type:complete len:258 (-) Transcript_86418:95-868(-)